MPVSARFCTFADQTVSTLTLGRVSLTPHAVGDALNFGTSSNVSADAARREAVTLAEPLVLAVSDSADEAWGAGLRANRRPSVTTEIPHETTLGKDLALLRGWLDRPVGTLLGRQGMPTAASYDFSRDRLSSGKDLPIKQLLFGASVFEPEVLLDLAYGILRRAAPAWQHLPLAERAGIYLASEEAHRNGRVGLPEDLMRGLGAGVSEELHAGSSTSQRATQAFLLSGMCLVRADLAAMGGRPLAESLGAAALAALRRAGRMDAAAMASELWTELLKRRGEAQQGVRHRAMEGAAARDWRASLARIDDERAEVVRIFQGVLYALAGASWRTVETFWDEASLLSYRRGQPAEEALHFVRMAQSRVFGAIEEDRDFLPADWQDVDAMLAGTQRVFAAAPGEDVAFMRAVGDLRRAAYEAAGG